jgi:hypothetical protein
MSELRIPPDQSEHLPPYFERNAADVKPEEWPTYEPLAYEVWMLEAVARRLAALPADESLRDEDRPLKDALLESSPCTSGISQNSYGRRRIHGERMSRSVISLKGGHRTSRVPTI